MKSYLHIKGKNLWKLCALALLGIAVGACYIRVQNIDQPATATVGQTITIQLTDTVQTNIGSNSCGGCVVAAYVLGILMPTGWNAAANTTVTYTSQLGNGNMALMPASTLEPSNSVGSNLTWTQALTKKYGIGNNLVNDVQWVVFQSTQQYTIDNEIHINPNATIQIKVGADNDNTESFPAYFIADSSDGLGESDASDPEYNEANGGCLIVTGGSTGILHDYCHPQLTTVNPPKSLSNEFITLTYNNTLATTALSGNTNLYLCVDTAYTSDGKVLTNFCFQTEQSHLVQTTSNSGLFSLTFWPQSYFGLTATETVTRFVYHVTDQTGNTRVGYGGSTTQPFSYIFGCN